VTKPTPNFTQLDPGRPEIAIVVDAMLRAREVVASRSWATSQEPTSEDWWADVLADPRARLRRQPQGLDGRDSKRTARKSHYRLADEHRPLIEVACSKCEWKAAFSERRILCQPNRRARTVTAVPPLCRLQHRIWWRPPFGAAHGGPIPTTSTGMWTPLHLPPKSQNIGVSLASDRTERHY
jgi:hypothetical protein